MNLKREGFVKKNLTIILVLAVLIFYANLGGTSVYILDEAKNAGCAAEMLRRGDPVVPTFNGALRTDKPPLHYWFMMSAYTLGGVTPFTARFFSALMGVLTVVVVYVYVRRLVSEKAGMLSALVLLSSLQLGVQFHLAVPDPYLIFFFTLGLLSFIAAWISGDSRLYYLTYGSLAFATLAKGPVAVVFAGVTVLLFIVWQRRLSWRTLRDIQVIGGALLFLLIVVPWYLAVGIETEGAWLEQFFLKHNLGRFSKTMEGHGGFPLASVVIVIGALMPFSFFIPQVFRWFWREQRHDALLSFCVIAGGVVVVFFAFSRTILPSYPEPAVPFFAILLGCGLAALSDHDTFRFRFMYNGIVYGVVALALPVAVYIALRQEADLADLTSLAWAFVVFPVGAGVAIYFLYRRQLLLALYSYTATAVLFLLMFFWMLYPQIDARNPVARALPQVPAGAHVVHYRDFNPAFVFARGHVINEVADRAALQHILADHREVYILTQKRYVDELTGVPMEVVYEGKDLFENPITVVLKTKAAY